jgi:hypothetical protein
MHFASLHRKIADLEFKLVVDPLVIVVHYEDQSDLDEHQRPTIVEIERLIVEPTAFGRKWQPPS